MSGKYIIVGRKTGGVDAPLADGQTLALVSPSGRYFSQARAIDTAGRLNVVYPDGNFIEAEILELDKVLAGSSAVQL